MRLQNREEELETENTQGLPGAAAGTCRAGLRERPRVGTEPGSPCEDRPAICAPHYSRLPSKDEKSQEV